METILLQKHPGFVIMDEPLQQNPDELHRDLFAAFLANELAQKSKFQTLIFYIVGCCRDYEATAAGYERNCPNG